MLLGATASALLMLIALIIVVPLGLGGEQGEIGLMGLAVLATLLGSGVLYLLNRHVSGTVASALFVVLTIAIAALADKPYEVVDGRGLIVFAIPILAASALLRPWASFVAAGACSVVIVVMGMVVVGQPVPNLPGVAVFFLLAVISWLSSRSLERALENLRASEERYRTLFERLPVGLFRTTPDGRFLDANPAHVQLLGCPDLETLLETPVTDFYAEPTERRHWKATVEEEGVDQVWEVAWRRLDGTPIWVQEHARAIYDDEGQVAYYDGIVVDTTERRRAEERVKHLNRTLRAIRNVNQLITKERDPDRLLQGACEALIETRGYQTAWAAVFDEEGEVTRTAQAGLGERAAALTEQLQRGSLPLCGQRALPQSGTVTIQDRPSACTDCPLQDTDGDGMTARLEHEGEVYGLLSVSIPADLAADQEEQALFREVAEDLAFALHSIRREEQRQRMEEQLRRHERLAAVGQLAGGIAHDFNNILAGIILYAQMPLRRSDLPPRTRNALEAILQESHRAADLIQQILDFSRSAMMETKPVSLIALVEEATTLLRRTIPENVRLVTDWSEGKPGREPGPCIVQADSTRIHQVLMNLALNAKDAMPEGGELRIGVDRVSLASGDARAGAWARLTVSDTGTGMSEEVQEHLFEPFFTTKEPGEGTGLGLAQVYGIVKQHEGFIDVDSAEGEGTTFTILLPLVEGQDKVEVAEQERAQLQGQGETVLVVEDAERLRRAVEASLASMGYRVLAAANGQEALDVVAQHEVDLVLTDVIMPEMGGEALLRRLRALDPRLKIIAMTGHVVEKDVKGLEAAGFNEALPKPFTIDELTNLVRHVLDT
jgi:PAS domain S-box-containing protein